MALYVFECEECEKTVEVIQNFDDEPPVCECGGTMKRVLSDGNVVLKFKGNGFYENDYPKKVKKVKDG